MAFVGAASAKLAGEQILAQTHPAAEWRNGGMAMLAELKTAVDRE
jgi:hypothetical protein